ncbi:class I SAM-dependent methyltransferase [Dyella jiangningensis]|uniref:class I SAM-dependent methyltransferase n=1 Tax=Dyella jiangningensis TaxID=1379159 RepID=UPI00240F4292|nr:class I SAM-dependent methyltransferase [Dyella jiangningensis]MDG2537245.1 class I SAM-dependent methyltransferase [Dyella jiangningensis]
MSAVRSSHWDSVYAEKGEVQTSWFSPRLDESLRLIDALDLPRDVPVLDVGGGRSTLADDLLSYGYSDVSVLDLSSVALNETRQRLGAKAEAVHWIVGDVTRADLPSVGLWHDRAVLHFLVDAGDRVRYVAAASRVVKLGGYLVIGVFAADGPERCSGLPVARYDAPALAGLFKDSFELIANSRDVHRTPSGGSQAFTYVVLRRRGGENA